MSKTLDVVSNKMRGLGLFALVVFAIVGFFGGQLIWNNLRSDDPFLAGWEPYEKASFEQALADGGPVIVEIYASWCPICIVQHQAFEKVWSKQDYPLLTAYRVDFDLDKDFVEAYGVRGTGILMYFRDGTEAGRFTGLTSEEGVAAFLDEAARL